MIEARIDSGIEMAMISVERHEPRNSRIINPVSAAAITPSRITPETAARTNSDWSEIASTCRFLGMAARIRGSILCRLSTMSSVDASPIFRIDISTAR